MIAAEIIYNFYDELLKLMSQNSSVSPIVLASPYSFFNKYAVDILGTKQNIAQVSITIIASYITVAS